LGGRFPRRHNTPQHADAGLDRLACLTAIVYFAIVDGYIARRG